METKRRIRPELEGLRTIAAILVAIYHIWFNRVSGGVDVFFVVSGFLITTSLLSMYRKNGKVLYFSYIVKLMKRLLPTAWLISITTLIAGLYILPVFTKQQTLNEFLASAFYFQNWRLAIDSVDYLAQNNSASPFQHFWALSIQFQFYLVWLLLFFVAITLLRLFSSNHIKRMLIIVISVVAIASFGYSVYLTIVNQPVAYYHTFTRVWEFGVGGILALTIHKIVISSRLSWVLGWMGLIGLISCGIVLQVSQLFPGYAALWPVLSAVLIIVAGNYSTHFSAFRLLSWKPLVKFGSISYAFYLWHWPLLIFYYALFEVETVSLIGGLLIMTVAAIFAYVTIYGFEVPVRNIQLSLWKTASIIFVFSGAIWLSTFIYQESSLALPVADSETLSERINDHPGAAVYLEDGRLTPLAEFDEPFIPRLEVAEQDRSVIYEERCMVGKVTTAAKVCEYGELIDYDYTIALVGGSHSAHWQPMLEELAKTHNLKIVTYLKSSCRFTEEDVPGSPECAEWFTNVKTKIAKDTPDLIFTVGNVGSQQEEFDEVSDGFIEAWKYFEKQDIPLFLVRDTPWYKQHVLTCLSQNADEPEQCKAKQEEIVRDVNPITQADYMPETATTIDLTDYFCDGEYCHYVVGNVITHFDANHLTATFSRSFAPVFEKPILEALEK
ncbi:acyltransferase [Planococcus sp. ANT_H30]|uniref:acyltransferase family protein n=1 Tax=Planococcus sp. ANT_H30 TaxID=2597347 RepID=UPI0011EF3523|nr:acyltransferase family protein [Planococcus sp. ANT_H30]KAA0957879.1 acyltransferase [Planococcus sp. ANT_H30]